MVRSNAPIALLRAKSGAAWPGSERTLHGRIEAAPGAGLLTLSMIANITIGRRDCSGGMV